MNEQIINFLDFGFILSKYLIFVLLIFILNFIFTVCAMIVISQDSKNRKVKCWHWNLMTFFFGFIPVILYLIIVCGNKNKSSSEIIDMRNSNENNISTTNNLNQLNIKTPKYLIFYIIIQIVLLIINALLIQDIFGKSIAMINYGIKNNLLNENNIIYENQYIDKNENYQSNILDENKTINNKGNINFNNLDDFDDIEDYSSIIYSSSIDKILNNYYNAENNLGTFYSTEIPKSIIDNLNKYYKESSPEMLNSAIYSLIEHFKSSLVTYKFDYENSHLGILEISPNIKNFSKQQIKEIKKQTKGKFFGDDLTSVIIISQNVEGNNIFETIDLDIDDFETENLNEYPFVKGYPIYVSFYSDISSSNYSLNISLK